ncbi:MAG: co-chaperone GroES [Candidatus Moranbacteria bacterium]|nr:co-chaperone GroES [Candidatus Moranbacteria bacterium]
MKIIKVRPLGENVLVEPEKQEKKTGSGIYLPETVSKEKPQQGKIIAVGESKKIEVKKGQKVIYNRYSGTEVEIESKEYLIVKAEDIVAVLE